MKSIVLLISFLVLCFPSKTQENNVQKVVFRLICSETNGPVSFAHVYNESKRFGTISDSTGKFEITASVDDTLIFIALGYLGKYYIVQPADFRSLDTIFLGIRAYKIEEINLTFPRTYKQFKNELLVINPDKNRVMPELPRYNKYKTPYLLDENRIYSADFLIAHPISGLYYRYSKVEKSKRKVWRLQQEEMKRARVEEKFNRTIAAEISGLSGNELTEFIGFCNFSFDYLFTARPYDILVETEQKFHDYIECCYDEKTNTNP